MALACDSGLSADFSVVMSSGLDIIIAREVGFIGHLAELHKRGDGYTSYNKMLAHSLFLFL